jgi:hypothetical protein
MRQSFKFVLAMWEGLGIKRGRWERIGQGRHQKSTAAFVCVFFTRILSTMNYAKIKLKNTGQDV